jgi:hypothetical protein
MSALLGAKLAAADAVRSWYCIFSVRALAALAAASVLSACIPATVPIVGKDPADPAAKVAGVGYRSTIAPYTSVRPSAPAPWRERNDSVAPQPKSNQ